MSWWNVGGDIFKAIGIASHVNGGEVLTNGCKDNCNDDLRPCYSILSDQQGGEKNPCTGSKELLSFDAGTDLHHATECDAEERERGNSVIPYSVTIEGTGGWEMADGDLGNSAKPP